MLRHFFRAIFVTSLLTLASFSVFAQVPPPDEAARLLPDGVGSFRAEGTARPLIVGVEHRRPEDFAVASSAARYYTGRGGENVRVEVVTTGSPSAAYSLLLYNKIELDPAPVGLIRDLGTVGIDAGSRVRFIKGSALVDVRGPGRQGGGDTPALAFAKAYTTAAEGEAAEIPALVQHLPEWEAKAREGIVYAVSMPVLQPVIRQPVLEAVSFEGGTEAVAAYYDGVWLVIFEFTTPQYAAEADARVTERLAQLRSEGRPVPTAYRREGNYSVFVFDAADEAAAAGLIEQVRYEKDVRWLGDNPHALERAQRAYTNTMGGVILVTLKATGLAILVCLGLGGLVGGAVFLHRRARSASSEAYSDAGGMMRLNLEDVNTPRSPARLLNGGDE